MNWISIFSIVIGVLSLLIAYYRYMRNHPKLEVIDVCDTSTSAFKDYINDLEFSYKDQVYKELTSVELLIMNKSFRSIEKEDIRETDPLILYSESETLIHDVRVIKKVGNSIANIKIIDEQSVSLDISSMDKNSSLRIEVLGSGKDFKVNGKGKLINANYSISKITRLKKRSTFKELMSNGADIFRGITFISVLLIPIMFLISIGVEYSYTRTEAKILSPKEFLEAKNQFLILDSLQEHPKVSSIKLISSAKDTVLDTIELSTESTTWSMNWSGKIDPKASRLHDSLVKLGYTVNYGTGYENAQELINSGEYIFLQKSPSGFTILKKKLTGDKALNLFGESFQAGIYLIVLILIFVILAGAKTFRKSFKYRLFLTGSERKDLLKDVGRYDPARFFFWLLYLKR